MSCLFFVSFYITGRVDYIFLYFAQAANLADRAAKEAVEFEKASETGLLLASNSLSEEDPASAAPAKPTSKAPAQSKGAKTTAPKTEEKTPELPSDPLTQPLIVFDGVADVKGIMPSGSAMPSGSHR